ncbi:MAG TPA: PTS sugar transporter subunit IIB [Lactovum miscens]|uniref:PTS sugar transporter subunit IIB n=1 Tax=Lactovum miscens TaxID=190387 RepID=UPI002ED7CD9A
MSKIKVLVACGAGIATSTVAMKKVEDLFLENHIDAELMQIKISEAASRQDDADMLISTTILPQEYRIPTVKAIAFLTGIGKDKVEAEILDIVHNLNNH